MAIREIGIRPPGIEVVKDHDRCLYLVLRYGVEIGNYSDLQLVNDADILVDWSLLTENAIEAKPLLIEAKEPSP